MRWRRLRPGGENLWIDLAPISWPGAGRPWVDLADGGLGRAPREPHDLEAPAPNDGERIYLPPIDGKLTGEREALLVELEERHSDLLVQRFPGEPATSQGTVYDLTDIVAGASFGNLDELPEGARCVVGLIPGLSDDRSSWEVLADALVARGASGVRGITLRLVGDDRQELLHRYEAHREDLFAALFHRSPPDERAFARLMAQAGLTPSWRFTALGSGRQARNRELAALLALAGELQLRLGEPEAPAQQLFRASRWVRESDLDVQAVVREGNLTVLEALDGAAGTVAAEWAADGDSALVSTLEARYLS